MINSVYEEEQEVAQNSYVLFNNDVVRTKSANCCCWLDYTSGSGQFTLTKPGIYEILFNANISSSEDGAIGLVIASNGEPLQGTEMDYTVQTANLYGNVSANRLIRICPNASKSITVNNTSESTTPILVQNANIIIKKIA